MSLLHSGFVAGFLLFFSSTTSHAHKDKHHYAMDDRLVGTGYKICVMGDSGTGTSDQKKVAAALLNENCDQVRIVGDLIYPKGIKNENDPQIQEKFLLPYADLIGTSKKPLFYLSLGNHDYYGNEQIWIKLHDRYPFIFIPHRYYAESYPDNDVCFITVDTSPYVRVQNLLKIFGPGKWAKNRRKDLKGCKFSIVFGHHPYLSSGGHGNAKNLLKQFLNHHVIGKVDAYIAGHEHILSDEGTRKDTHLFVSGSGGQVNNHPIKKPEGGYGVARLGHLTIQFTKDTQEKVVGTFAFKEVTEQGTIVAHKKEILGKGIR